MINYQRQENETFNDYLLRIGNSKTSEENWKEMTSNINANLNLDYDESTYRKRYKALSTSVEDNKSSDSTISEMELELRKQKLKNAEERSLVTAYLKRISREETLKDIAQEVAAKMNAEKLLPPSAIIPIRSDTYKGILELSDWHYGICVDHAWNKYSPTICRQRVAKLRDEVVSYCKLWQIHELHVLNLSDLIAGRIHLQLRLDSRYDVMTQTIHVAEILAEFLSDLAEDMEIHYYDCLDNHSRIEPKKADSWDLESLARIIPWYLKSRLSKQNVIFHENEFGPDIITLKLFDHNILGVHGDNDSLNKIIENMTLMTKRSYDLICTAHLHHFSGDERNETIIVSNSSLMGTDNFAKSLRLSSKPSQNLIVVTKDNPIASIHRILL